MRPGSRRAWRPERPTPGQPVRGPVAGPRRHGHYARCVMDVRAFCTQSRVVIVAGKGGVGKTTMVAALAHLAAGAGLSVLVVELEGRKGVATAFGREEGLDYAGQVLHAAGAILDEEDAGGEQVAIPRGTVHARTITPDDALLEYLA